jgi:hypothetical protein
MTFILYFIFLLQFQESEFNCWDKNYKLDYNDFRGSPELIKTKLGNAKAFTYIKFNYKIYFDEALDNYNIQTCLMQDRGKSWITTKEDKLLKHEQLHFDIAELYRRKIHKLFEEGIAELEIALLANRVKGLMKDLENTQEQYDEETGHGVISGKQTQWENKISNSLFELNKYSYGNSCNCDE